MLKVNDLLNSKFKKLEKDIVISPYSSIAESIKKNDETKYRCSGNYRRR